MSNVPSRELDADCLSEEEVKPIQIVRINGGFLDGAKWVSFFDDLPVSNIYSTVFGKSNVTKPAINLGMT